MMRKESGSNSLTFFVTCMRDSPRPGLPAGFELSLRPSPPAGRDFGPVRTCGAFPPTAARRAPHRSRSHGRLRRPKSLPIRHSPAAAQCFSPWAAGIASVLTSALAAIAKSGPEIRNRCTDYSGFGLFAAAIVKLTPSNQESLHGSPRNVPHCCSDCQIDPLKSRITARISLKCAPLLQRLPSLGLKS